MVQTQTKDYLWLNLKELPYFRGLLRAVEARAYQDMDLPAPTLDLGCGDGHFAGIAFERNLEVGVDPWWSPLKEAQKRASYRSLLQAEGASLPFPNRYFGSAVSNSVLEHIPHLDSVLTEVARVLQPGAVFIFCVPNHYFLTSLSVGKWFDQAGLHALGDIYRRFFNKISRHYHCDPPEVWQKRLEVAGFKVERWWHYFSAKALHILEWGHYWGLPSWISKLLTGRWILSATPWNLALTRRLVQPYYDEAPRQENGAYTFYIAHRI